MPAMLPLPVRPDRRELFVHLLPIVLGQGAGLACGVVGVWLATRWVAPEDYGKFALFVTLVPLGPAVVHAGLMKYVARHWAAAPEPAQVRSIVKAALRRSLPVLAVLAAGAAFLVPAAWGLVFPALGLSTLALTGQSLVHTAWQAERRNWWDFWAGLGSSALRTLVPLATYVATAGGVAALVGGFALQAVLVAALVTAAGGWWLRTPTPAGPSMGGAFAGPRFALLAAMAWLSGASGRWICAVFFGAEETGYFALAGNLALVAVAVVFSVVQQFVQPRLFALVRSHPGDPAKLWRTVEAVWLGGTLAGVAGLVLLVGVLPRLVGTVISPVYAPALPWVLPAGCFSLALLGPLVAQMGLVAVEKEDRCGPPEIAAAAALLIGALVAAAAGIEAFRVFALGSPIVPWLTARPLARRAMAGAQRSAGGPKA